MDGWLGKLAARLFLQPGRYLRSGANRPGARDLPPNSVFAGCSRPRLLRLARLRNRMRRNPTARNCRAGRDFHPRRTFMSDDLLSLLPRPSFSRRRVRRHDAGRRVRPGRAAGLGRDDHDRHQGPGGRRGQDSRPPTARSPPTGRCRTRAARSRSSWSCRRSSASTSTSRTSAAASPSSATWPSPPSCTPGRGTSRSSPTSRRSSPRSSPRCPTPR